MRKNIGYHSRSTIGRGTSNDRLNGCQGRFENSYIGVDDFVKKEKKDKKRQTCGVEEWLLGEARRHFGICSNKGCSSWKNTINLVNSQIIGGKTIWLQTSICAIKNVRKKGLTFRNAIASAPH